MIAAETVSLLQAELLRIAQTAGECAWAAFLDGTPRTVALEEALQDALFEYVGTRFFDVATGTVDAGDLVEDEDIIEVAAALMDDSPVLRLAASFTFDLRFLHGVSS